MEFPARAQASVIALHAKHPDLAAGDDDQRRALTKIMAEQIRFDLGAEWGTKRADPNRPPSKDAIAYQSPSGLVSWDWQNGGTRAPQVPPLFHEIPDQVFIPVSGVNHLGHVVVVVPPYPVPPSPPVQPPTECRAQPVDLAPVLAELAALLAEAQALRTEVQALRDMQPLLPARAWPTNFKGRSSRAPWLGEFTLTPTWDE